MAISISAEMNLCDSDGFLYDSIMLFTPDILPITSACNLTRAILECFASLNLVYFRSGALHLLIV